MKKSIYSIAATAMLLFSMSAAADVAQVWQCQLADGKTNDDLMELSQQWLDAAKELNEDASVRIYFPIAGEGEEGSIVFIFYLPDFNAWGEYSDAYPGSAVAAVDATWNEVAPCEVSSLWATADLE